MTGRHSAELAETLSVLSDLIGEIQTKGLNPADARVHRLVADLRARPQLAGLPGAILKTYNEISAALSGIRITRETIKACALDRLRVTHDRLAEVSQTTETAALEILNGLDRSLATLDQLERQDGALDQGRATILGQLRNELNQLFNHLQFQDITSQQLRGVIQALLEVEQRIETVAVLLDQSLGETPTAADVLAPAVTADTAAYNPEATVRDAGRRQEEIDRAIQVARAAAAAGA